MYSQKRIKTIGYDPKDQSEKKQRKQKQQKSAIRAHKVSEAHIKSASKDVHVQQYKITPKKNSVIVQKSKYKQTNNGNAKNSKHKQLTSVCSYSMIQKQSMPATKRKGSNAHSIKKQIANGKSKDKICLSVQSTVNNFSVLTKCLTQYIKQEKKTGNNPSKQVLHLIKAFNRSQVATISKDFEKLISKMLDYIEGTVQFSQTQQKQELIDEYGARIKSRSSYSEPSEHQIQYSQILQHSFVPSTVKKPNKNQHKQSTNDIINESKNKINVQAKHELQEQPANKKIVYKKEQKYLDKQLQRQLKNDIKNMHNELFNLRTVGQKLQQNSHSKYEDRIKLQQVYIKNKRKLTQYNKSITENLKNGNFKTEQDQQQEVKQQQNKSDGSSENN